MCARDGCRYPEDMAEIPQKIFKHFDLTLIRPDYDSPLVDTITALEKLRNYKPSGSTPPAFFFQIKEIFHWVESVASARIEGNRTTLSQYAEYKIDQDSATHAPAQELLKITNLNQAMRHIENTITKETPFTHLLIRDWHALAVQNLSPANDGDQNPGKYREIDVKITKSTHHPPNWPDVYQYMDELINFINREDPEKYDLIKVALAHHRFCWIHPFANGNGRTARLLTYALLIRFGFNVKNSIINPAAVFCNNRDLYYKHLSDADDGNSRGLEDWCYYTLEGIHQELEKLNRITNYENLKNMILLPALSFALDKNIVSGVQYQILKICLAKTDGTFKAVDIPDMTPRQKSYEIKKLIDEKMLKPVKPGARSYTISFSGSPLVRGVVRMLLENGFAQRLED